MSAGKTFKTSNDTPLLFAEEIDPYYNSVFNIGSTTAVWNNVYANKFITTGGSSSQFVKGDGSLDTNTYLTSINSSQVTTALGYTPYNSTNPANYISLNSLSASSPLSYSTSTGVFSISQASGSTNGYLSSTDWNTFNNKQSALTNPVTGTGVSGQVAFWNGTTTQTGDSNLFWDNTNKYFGIGTSAPSYPLDVNGIINASSAVQGTYIRITTTGGNGIRFNSDGYIINQANGIFRWSNGSDAGFTRLNFGGTTSSYPALSVNGGNLAITDAAGTFNAKLLVSTTTDNGIGSLQVNGKITALVSPTATSTYGTLSLGGGAFDGVTTGKFVGSATGTSLAINEATGYTGNLLDLQVAGVSKFKMDNSGNITTNNIISSNGAATGRYINFNDSSAISVGNSPYNKVAFGNTGQVFYNGAVAMAVFSDNGLSIKNGATATISGVSLVVGSGNVGFGTSSPVSKLHIAYSPTATSTYGTLSLGGGAFDGVTTGFFTGNASGTSLAINEVSSYTGNLLDLQVAGSSKFNVNANGKIGVGTSTPSSLFHVYGSNSAGDFAVTNTGSSNSISMASLLAPNSTGDVYFTVGKSLTNTNAGLVGYSTVGGSYAFLTTYGRAASDFAVTTSGKVGVGTYGPLSRFSVLVSGTQLSNADNVGTAGNFEGPTPTGQGSTLSIISNDAVAANIGGVLGFGGNYNGTQYANWAAIKGLKYDATSGNYGGYLSFWTRQTGASSLERMRIDTNGNVGIGTGTPNQALDVSGNIWIGRNSTSSATNPDGNSNAMAIVGDTTLNSIRFGEIIMVANTSTANANFSTGQGLLGGFGYANYNISATDKRVSAIYGGTDGAINSGLLVFATWNAGTYGERMRLRSNGNLLIATTTDNGAGILQTAGNIVPSANNSYTLGSSSYKWSLVYSNGERILTAPTATSSYGTLSLGGGAFDGVTAGFFTGNASGTSLAVNEVSGYTGDLMNLQVAGVSKFKMDNSGTITIGGANGTDNAGLIFKSNGNYTGFKINDSSNNYKYAFSYSQSANAFYLYNNTNLGYVWYQTNSGFTGFGGNTSPSGLVSIGGTTFNTASWGTSGIQFNTVATSINDTSAAGTVTNAVANSFAASTFRSSNTRTITNASTLYIEGSPIAGTNTTITNPYALYINGGTSYFGGNVGIGTTAPVETLDVRGGLQIGTPLASWGSPLGSANVSVTNSTGNSVVYMGQSNSRYAFFGWTYNATAGSAYANFATAGYNNQIRIDGSSIALNSASGGNVGIGTTAPSYKLSIAGRSEILDSTNGGGIWLGKTSDKSFIGRDNADLFTGIWNGSSWGLTALDSGNVGIGTTTPSAMLSVTGSVRFSNFGAGTLQTDALGNLTVSSDERLKNISGPYTRSISDLLKINPISYHWNALSGLDQSQQYSGFSAQNIQSAIPEAVSTSSNGFLSLQDRPILAAVVNAVKEIAQIAGEFKDKLVAWLGDSANGLTKVSTGEICLKDSSGNSVCIDGDRLKQMMDGQNISAIIGPTQPQSTPTNNSSSTPSTTASSTTVVDNSASSTSATVPTPSTTSSSTPVVDNSSNTSTSSAPIVSSTPVVDTSSSNTNTTASTPAPAPTPTPTPDTTATASVAPAPTPAPAAPAPATPPTTASTGNTTVAAAQ